MSLFFAGLRRVGPTTASILSTAEPVTTVVLAFVVFGESLGAVQLVGGALVVGAVFVRARRPGGSHGARGVRAADAGPLEGKVALVTGATRGAGRGTAVALGEGGATVYCTGRTTRAHRSEIRPAGDHRRRPSSSSGAAGAGIAVEVDHLQPDRGAGPRRADR